ncbi:TolC family protein [Marinitoga lauensis]|uniref:TolC family protein n=1 Tax=Marinitoga lauensis TaxID=2201189 RepID=UPI00101319EA|nr:TolC family protein [Marinitoga lauensis]
MKKIFVLLLTIFGIFIIVYGENNIKNIFLNYEDAYKYYVSILNSNHEIKNENILEKYSDFLPYISYNFGFNGDKISGVNLNTSSIDFSWSIFRADFLDKTQMNKLNKQIANLNEENVKKNNISYFKSIFYNAYYLQNYIEFLEKEYSKLNNILTTTEIEDLKKYLTKKKLELSLQENYESLYNYKNMLIKNLNLETQKEFKLKYPEKYYNLKKFHGIIENVQYKPVESFLEYKISYITQQQNNLEKKLRSSNYFNVNLSGGYDILNNNFSISLNFNLSENIPYLKISSNGSYNMDYINFNGSINPYLFNNKDDYENSSEDNLQNTISKIINSRENLKNEILKIENELSLNEIQIKILKEEIKNIKSEWDKFEKEYQIEKIQLERKMKIIYYNLKIEEFLETYTQIKNPNNLP